MLRLVRNGFVSPRRWADALDGRADPYPQAVWNDYATIVGLHTGWGAALHGRGTDAVLTARSEPLAAALQLSDDWRRTYANESYSVWTLVTSDRNRALARRASAQPGRLHKMGEKRL